MNIHDFVLIQISGKMNKQITWENRQISCEEEFQIICVDIVPLSR